jgi:hemerythrin-like metal-binding protein
MALTTNPNRREIEFFLQLVSFMDAYIAVHFKHEEECMASHKCPAYKENQAAHREFLLFFRKFKLRFETEGFRPEVVKELHESCDAWIQHHIMQIDVQLRPCLSRQASPENQG